MTDTSLPLPLDTVQTGPAGYERIWYLAQAQELGLVVEVPEGENCIAIQTALYMTRKAMMEAQPTLDLMSFYITLPATLSLILIVRQPKDEPLE